MELKVKVERVCYPAPSIADTEKGNVWYILATDKGTCKGSLCFRPEPGQLLKLEGKNKPYQGRQEFAFTGGMQDVPISARDQLRYICDRTKGIGMAMELEIWNLWGDRWTKDVAPGIIPRLGGVVYEELRNSIETLETDKEKAEAISWLMGKGATLALASTAFEYWGKQTITMVNADCYVLADLPNFGFQNVDQSVRHAFGITDADNRRIKAAVVYSIGQLTSTGSTVVTWNELVTKSNESLRGMYSALIADCVREMFESGRLRGFPETQSISLGKDYENEVAILAFVSETAEKAALV